MTVESGSPLSPTREAFVDSLEDRLFASEGDPPVVVVVSGEPGLGKTTALDAIHRRRENSGGATVRGVDATESLSVLRRMRQESSVVPPLLLIADDIDRWDPRGVESLALSIAEPHRSEVRVLASSHNGCPAGLAATSPLRLNLPRLAEAEIEELLRADGTDDPHRLAAIVARSGGNPWVARELRRSGSEDLLRADPLTVPETVARRFHRVISDLPSAVKRSLVVLAAADGGELGVIAKALGVLGEPMPSLEDAEAAGLIEVSGGRVSFTHPVLRAVSYRAVGLASRRAAHAALATAMSRPAQAAGRAHHLVAASSGPDAVVAEALVLLAERAAAQGVHRDAAEFFERAARFSVGGDQANRCLAQAALEWRTIRDPSRAGELLGEVDLGALDDARLLALCELHRWLAGPTAALARLDAAHFDDPALAAAVRSDLTLELFGLDAADRATKSLDGSASGALAVVRSRVEGTRPTKTHDDMADPRVHRWLRVHELTAMSELGLGSARGVAATEELLGLAQDSALRCELVDADRCIEMARAMHPEGAVGEELELLSLELVVAQLRGRSAVTTWDPDDSLHGEPAPAAWLWARGRVALDAGEQDAVDFLRRAAGLRPELYGADLVTVLGQLGRVTEAAGWADLIPDREPSHAPLQVARGLRAKAVVHDDDRRFRLAADLAQENGLVLDHFESLLAQAESLARRGASAEAHELAGLVGGGLGRFGVGCWHRRLAAVATSDNDPPIEQRLTPAEVRVATAVAGGGTNKQLAADLYLSVKTVDYHLQNIYKKLEIRSRTELAVLVSRRAKEASDG